VESSLKKSNAISLWVKGGLGLFGRKWLQVGYVPESDAGEVAEWLRAKRQVSAFIWRVVGGGELSYGVRINIVLHDASENSAESPPSAPRYHKRKAPRDTEPIDLRVDLAPTGQARANETNDGTIESINVANLLASIGHLWIPPMPAANRHTLKVAVQLAFFEGIAFAAIGGGLWRPFEHQSDPLPVGVVMAAIAAAAWGTMTTFGFSPADPRSRA
jgi:hypothetical protein